jgi:NADPH-dependent ferric siderophore reductase
MIKYAGIDPEGTARVYGQALTNAGARERCLQAIEFYVHQHPETGPASAWQIKRIRTKGREWT